MREPSPRKNASPNNELPLFDAQLIKQMTKSGVIKRTDTGMFIALSDIHVREGFNKREDDERTRQADDDLFNYLMNGGSVPPLEVIARDEGGVTHSTQ